MKKVTVRAPVRADLAGGTLDLWPLYLFHPGSRTVNVAISYHAESEVLETGDGAIEIHLTDQQYKKRYESMAQLAADPKAALIHRALEHFHLTGIRITTRTDAPRGSGLGGSSALTITLVRALSEIARSPVEADALITLVRDLETRLLGGPAGIQDYYPPVYGGLSALHLNPGVVSRHPISLPVAQLTEHFLLHYSGVAHFSGTNNWEMYKRQIDRDGNVHDGLEKIAQTAIAMEKALEAGDMQGAGEALAQEWDAAISAARGAGAWAGKVCGAGGGGCIVFLMPADRKEEVRRALASVPGRAVEAVPVAHGLTIDITDDSQSTFSFARGRLMARPAESLEQLYVYGGHGDYKPYLLAEGVITHSESRSGIHQTTVRSYMAPISGNDGSVDWSQARPVTPETFDIRAVPESRHKMDTVATAEALMQGATQSEDAFRQFVEQTEKLHIFHNAAFGLWSQANESRDAFLQRCMESANRMLEDQSERLESTFRRRIDQLREKSEREQREHEDENVNEEGIMDVNVAWGQALYNITSGRPAAVADTPHSVREVDYLENIAQIQKAWDRELESRREELTSKARSIEEMTITPAAKNIEITKYLILWSAQPL
jgi:D-glycero-alpha-D-manno-heptose-7-phosphate kinase